MISEVPCIPNIVSLEVKQARGGEQKMSGAGGGAMKGRGLQLCTGDPAGIQWSSQG